MADSVNHPITLSILAALGHPDMEVAELAYTESLGTSGLREATVDITTDGAEPPLDIHATHERFFGRP